VLQETIERDAEGLGISVKTLRRAKKSLGVESAKRTYQGKYEWVLPTHFSSWPSLTEPTPDKASLNEVKQNMGSTKDGQWPPLSEANRNAGSINDGQTSLGVGDNWPDNARKVHEAIKRLPGRIVDGRSLAGTMGAAVESIESALDWLASHKVIESKGASWLTSPVKLLGAGGAHSSAPAKASSQDEQYTPSVKTRRNVGQRSAPAKASSKDAHCALSVDPRQISILVCSRCSGKGCAWCVGEEV
jgi:hypothetical protein